MPGEITGIQIKQGLSFADVDLLSTWFYALVHLLLTSFSLTDQRKRVVL